MKRHLQISENARQVFDAGGIWNTVKRYYFEFVGMTILSGVGVYGIGLIGMAVGIEPHSTTWNIVGVVYLAICALILLGMALAAGVATGIGAIGVWIDPATNRLVYPHDGVARSFADLITFRWFRSASRA